MVDSRGGFVSVRGRECALLHLLGDKARRNTARRDKANQKQVPSRRPCVQVRVVHSGHLYLPLRLKAFAIVHEDMARIREWLPEELKEQATLLRNRMIVELKGSTVVSYVFQTTTVRAAPCVPAVVAGIVQLKAGRPVKRLHVTGIGDRACMHQLHACMSEQFLASQPL